MILLFLLACQGGNGGGYAGTIEVTEVEVASVLAGRLAEVAVDEGDRVQPGDLVFTLATSAIDAEVEVRAAMIGVAAASVETARSQVEVADAQVRWLKREVERAGKMEKSGVGTAQQVSSLDGQLAVARAQAATAREAVAQAEAARVQAEAALKVAEEHLSEARVLAAVGGVVLSRNREPGEVVAPGTSVITLGDLDRPRLRIYVSTAVVGTLAVGHPVTVRTDARAEPYPGRIVKIAGEAEYTPRDILTPEERVKRVFAVDVALDPAPGLLPGVPAEARL